MRSTFIPCIGLIVAIAVCCSPCRAQHTNVRVGDYFPERDYYPNEPSIAIDPNNSDQMIVTTNGPVNHHYYSEDGGLTWTGAGDYSFDDGLWGDPCVIADTSGHFHFFHLERLYVGGQLQMPDRIFCRTIACDQMASGWSRVSYTGLNPPKMQDKEWGVYCPASDNLYVVWSEFDVYGSPDPAHFTNVLFSRSLNGGVTWSEPKRINEVSGDCLDESDSVMGAMPAVGPNGEIYVSWPGPEGITIDISTDGGTTWLAEDIQVADNPAGDHYYVPGVSRGGSCPVVACDLSEGPHRGTVYVNWTDWSNGADDTDVWLSRSTDGGYNWSDPLRVNDDPPGKHQFFHWLAVDPTNGYLYIVFYDRRNYDDNQTDVYLAVSRDGGETFTNHLICESPFTPHPLVFMGDYSNIAALGDVIRPVWVRTEGRQNSVWTAIVDPDLLTDVPQADGGALPEAFALSDVYPNPFNASATIRYHLSGSGHVELMVYNILGEEVTELAGGTQKAGEHRIVWNAAELASGVYFIRLKFETMSMTRKAVLIR
jgi:hypothetical protein